MGKYLYYIYPELSFIRPNSNFRPELTRFVVEPENHLSTVLSRLRRGVQVYGGLTNYGGVSIPQEDIEEYGSKQILKYYSEKYKHKKDQVLGQIADESIPLYLLKVPYTYLKYDKEMCDKNLVLLPYLDIGNAFYQSRMGKVERNELSNPRTIKKGVAIIPPEFVKSAYHDDFGGELNNPAWSPIFKSKGRTFDNQQVEYAETINEKESVLKIINCQNADEILSVMRPRIDELYQNYKIKDIIAAYQEEYKDDIAETRLLTDQEFINIITENADIARGL